MTSLCSLALKGSRTDASCCEDVGNARVFPFAGVIRWKELVTKELVTKELVTKELKTKKQNKKNLFEFEFLRAQPCWFALTIEVQKMVGS